MRPAALVTLGRSPSAARPPSHGSRRRQNSLTQKRRRACACRGDPPPDGKRQPSPPPALRSLRLLLPGSGSQARRRPSPGACLAPSIPPNQSLPSPPGCPRTGEGRRRGRVDGEWGQEGHPARHMAAVSDGGSGGGGQQQNGLFSGPCFCCHRVPIEKRLERDTPTCTGSSPGCEFIGGFPFFILLICVSWSFCLLVGLSV